MPLDPPFRLSLTNDFVFKAVLASSEDVLIALLTAVLMPAVPIRSATVLNPELPKDFADDKGALLDVSVKLDDGTRLDVEMQASHKAAVRSRILFYWAKLFASQLSAGDDHSRLARTISVLFLDYREFSFGQFHEVFRIRGEDTGATFSPLLEMHTIELPKLGQAGATHPPSEPTFVRWCCYLASQDPREIQQLASEDPMTEKAEAKVSALSADERVREIALERERRQIAWQLERTAAWDEGLEEGRAVGLQQGLERGLQQGERRALAALLEERFGPLTDEIHRRLDEADGATLQHWLKRLLSAGSLAAVLEK
jgi:predicted transposase/invertase (TIGR01784 family)